MTEWYLEAAPEPDEEMRAATAQRILEIVDGNGRYGGPTGDVTVELAPLLDADKRDRFLNEIQGLVDRMTDYSPSEAEPA